MAGTVGRWDLPIFLRAYALLLGAFGAAENRAPSRPTVPATSVPWSITSAATVAEDAGRRRAIHRLPSAGLAIIRSEH